MNAPVSPRRKPPARDRRSAFSLVEVAIAMGLFSFAIVSVIGLFAVSLNSDKGAADETVLARMAENSTSLLKTRGIEIVRANPAFGSNNVTPNFFFDVNGRAALATNGLPLTNAQADSIYSCVIRRKSTVEANRDVVLIEFRWPVTAPFNRQQSRQFQTSLVKYE